MLQTLRKTDIEQILVAAGILTPKIKWQAFRCKDLDNPGLHGCRWSYFNDRKVQYQKWRHRYVT